MPPVDDDLPTPDATPPSPKPVPPEDEPVPGELAMDDSVPEVPALDQPLLGERSVAEIDLDAQLPEEVPPVVEAVPAWEVVPDGEAVPVIEPVAKADPIPRAYPVSTRPSARASQPVATPVAAAPPPVAKPLPPKSDPVVFRPLQIPTDPPPKPQWFAACSVLGCFGVLAMAAVIFLVYASVLILSHVRDKASVDAPTKVGQQITTPRPGPVERTQLTANRVSLVLGGNADAVCHGANGRYLFLRLPKTKELVVFDPVMGSIVYRISLDDPRAIFTAGASKLYIYSTETEKISRYDLVTWQQEQSTLWAGTRPDALLIGPAADEPLLALNSDRERTEVAFLNTLSLRPFATETIRGFGSGRAVRISADGKVLGVAARPASTALAFRYSPGVGFVQSSVGKEGVLVDHISPSTDGKHLFTSRGVFSRSSLEKDDWKLNTEPQDLTTFTFPTAHGDGLYVGLPVARDIAKRFSTPLRLHLSENLQAAASFPTVPALDVTPGIPNEIPADLRVHVWPAAGLIAVLPANNGRLELYKVDVAAALKSGGADYTVFGSEPPTWATRGRRWSYRPEIWTSVPAGFPTKINVLAGPDGMTVNNGEVSWDVPVQLPDRPIEVRLQVTGGPVVGEQKFLLVPTAP